MTLPAPYFRAWLGPNHSSLEVFRSGKIADHSGWIGRDNAWPKIALCNPNIYTTRFIVFFLFSVRPMTKVPICNALRSEAMPNLAIGVRSSRENNVTLRFTR